MYLRVLLVIVYQEQMRLERERERERERETDTSELTFVKVTLGGSDSALWSGPGPSER